MKQLTKEDVKNLIIDIQNAILCVLWTVFVISLFVISFPIYVLWVVFNISHLYAWEAKFCGFLNRLLIKKTNTKTTKVEMMQFLQELQDLQMCIPNSSHEISFSIDFCVFKNSIRVDCNTTLFSDIDGTNKSKSIYLHNYNSYKENRKQLNYFIEYVKKLSKYGKKKYNNHS